MNADDREFILNILNYDMQPIFAALGFNTDGGEFIYARKDRLDPSTNLQIVQGLHAIGLPMDDDWLYETFSIQKPDNYEEIKAQKEAERQALQQALNEPNNPTTPNKPNKPIMPIEPKSTTKPNKPTQPTEPNMPIEPKKNIIQTSLKSRLTRFFGLAPTTGQPPTSD